MTGSGKYCVFLLNGLYFGIDVQNVQEVLRYQELTPVPLAAPEVEGLLNLRGQIVVAVDLRRRLNMPGRPAGASRANVVVHSPASAVSLLVDEISHVVDTTGYDVEPPPETLDADARKLVPAVCKLPDFILHILDAEQASSRRSESATA